MSEFGQEAMKNFYCHECGKNFLVADNPDPSCDKCGSGFVEFLEPQESYTVGGPASPFSQSSAGPPPLLSTPTPHPPPFSTLPASTTASAHRSAPSSANATTTATATATATSTTTAPRGTPINITIGANPLFGGGFFTPFAPPPPPAATATPSAHVERRDSPMETDSGDDPGDEILSSHLRRRTTGQVRGGHTGHTGIFPGGMFMVSQSSRGGVHRPSLGEMIHQHIQDVIAQRDREEGIDGGESNGEEAGQHPGGENPESGSRAAGGSSAGGRAGAGRGGTGRGAASQRDRRTNPANNVRFVNFPSVHVHMMPRGGRGGGGGQPSDRAGQAGGATGGQASSNPQMPQFGAPMIFGLPLYNPLMGLHGSPSDYAWGPQGLENIISQMLANLEDDGPPPTDKDKIEALPTIEATPTDLNECTHCSVCKDDFSAGEKLVKLPCCHLYHRECIIPWLEMHDTCPTCRFHINTGKYDDDERTSS